LSHDFFRPKYYFISLTRCQTKKDETSFSAAANFLIAKVFENLKLGLVEPVHDKTKISSVQLKLSREVEIIH
jgi:hypothetical protein